MNVAVKTQGDREQVPGPMTEAVVAYGRLAEAMKAAAIYGLTHGPDLNRIERDTREGAD